MNSQSWQFDAYGLPDQALYWREHALPEPGPGQALIRLSAIGMNRSEFNYVQGRYAPARSFPSCLGQEAVGTVVSLGPAKESPAKESPAKEDPAKQDESTPQFAIGDRVALLPGRVDICAMGTYRSVGLYDVEALAPVPIDYSDAEGAGLWMAVLTMGGALERAGVTPETAARHRIVITAASSGMGILALKLARAWGANTIATTRSVEKADLLAGLADHVVIADDSDALSTGISTATDGQGFTVALDPVGQHFYPGLIASAALGAHIVSYEMITGREPVMPIAQVMLKDLSLQGYTIFRAYREPGLLARLIDIGMRYSDAIRPLIADQIPLKTAPSALMRLGASEHLGKLVLIPEQGMRSE